MSQVELEWVDCKEAIRRVEAAGHSVAGSHPSALVDWARSGVVETRAQSLLVNDKPQEDRRIPTELWKVAEEGIHGHFNWRIGYLQGRVRMSLSAVTSLVKAHGIQFNAKQLSQFAPPVPAAPRTAPMSASSAGKGGSPGKVEAWHDFWLAALRMLNDGELHGFGTQAEVRRALLAAIGDRLSQESVKPQVAKIWHQILEK